MLRLNLSTFPPLRKLVGSWQTPASRAPSLTASNRFLFLNEAGNLSDLGWDHPSKTKLWRYNQHYFDDLNAERADERLEWHEALIDEWISGNPPGKGSGWEPYPTSLRIVNWIKWALSSRRLPQKAVDSLAVQTRWLAGHMEWHLLGNHLFVNAKALVFAGLFFDGAEADTWLSKGLGILKKEMDEQILSDGGHFELSPMYHALIFEDLVDLVNILQTFGKPSLALAFRQRIPVMISWLNTMSHPDGNIAFFNDASFGIAPTNAKLMQYASRLGFEDVIAVEPLCHLRDSGYVRMSAGPFTLIADFGRVGPDYLPGHAHADTLSIELSIAGQRVLVNSGTSEYGTGPERQRQRGTAAHNTVVVSGENSSEVWAGFRVGRRAYPQDVLVGQYNSNLSARASHDGYRFLPGSPRVTRCIELNETTLVISDFVTVGLPAEARYHIHPDVLIHSISTQKVVLSLPSGQCFNLESDSGNFRIESSTWHPEFGKSIPNFCLVLPIISNRAVLRIKSD